MQVALGRVADSPIDPLPAAARRDGTVVAGRVGARGPVAVVCALSIPLALVAACSIGSPSAVEGEADAAPIRVKTPTSNERSGTAPACDGVTEHGVCEDGAAIKCDVEAGELRRTDCDALGQRCVVDSVEGATCETGEATCDGDLDFDGFCDGEVARWCDAEGEKAWDCAADGFSCVVDVCEQGAFCCDEGGGNGGGNGGDPECEELGYYGECGGEYGQTARFCLDGEVIELDCLSDPAFSCQLDVCIEGADCCAGDFECPELGIEGECSGETVRYCNADDEYQEFRCTDFGMVCSDECNPEGADCCDLSCDDVPDQGMCIGDWLLFCDAGTLEKVNCPDATDGERPNCVEDSEDTGFAHCSE